MEETGEEEGRGFKGKCKERWKSKYIKEASVPERKKWSVTETELQKEKGEGIHRLSSKVSRRDREEKLHQVVLWREDNVLLCME